MLGHRLWINLRKEHEVWVTVHGDLNPFPRMPEFPERFIHYRVDALIFEEIVRALIVIQPELVINCIGLIKQIKSLVNDPFLSISLNALFPHQVSMLCRAANIRMIHISTDCVFSGKKGYYTESDLSDAEDLYGRTKFLGEVNDSSTITLRTSIIGQELKNNLGLIGWFLSQSGTIKGYKRAIYSGFTTDELSHIILNYVIPHPELRGVYHVSSNPISKFDLLMMVKEAYGKNNVEILPDQEFFCDRSLISTRFRQATGYLPSSWGDMIGEMASHASFYSKLEEKNHVRE
jgi:dTDP-4-dehydrorhamnose reductase